MGQLTNQFVSQSYQGLLNLQDANTGLTTNLQTVTDGLGGLSPLQLSQTQVNISGTFTINGAPISFDSSSLVTTSSFNAYTSSVNIKLAGLDVETGSLQNQINQKLDTGSFNTYTASNDSKVNSLIASTGSYATTSSLSAVSQSIAATDLAQNNRLTSIEGITGSLATTSSLNSYTLTSSFNAYTSSNDSKVNDLISKTGSYVTETESGSFMITGSVSGNVLTFTKGNGSQFNLTVNTGSVTPINTGSFATTGSNQFNGNQSISGSVQASSTITTLNGFVGPSYGSTVNASIYGDQLVDIKTQTTSNNGKVRLYSNGNYPFKVEVSGSLFVRDGITGSLQGTASYATQALSASWAPDNSNRNGLITTGSAGGNQSITGSLNVEGTISATSASFTYVNTVYETASVIYSSGSNQFGDASNDTQTLFGTVNLPNGPLTITGSLHQSGTFYPDVIDWYSSSIQQGTGSYVLTTDALGVTQYDSYQNVASALQPFISGSTVASSSFATNAATASIAYDLVVYGKCDNPGGLTRGTIVRIVGANGDNPLFNSASWTDDFNSANTLGMLSEDVAYNGFANVVVQGKVIGINTNGMTAGDLLFLSSSGQYTTSSVPAPYHEVRLGQVLRPNLNNGSAYVTIDNGYELTELHDVDITNPVNGDLLVYRSGSYGQWVNETGGELGYATTGSNNFVGQQNINGNLNVTGNTYLSGTLFVEDTSTYDGDLFVKSGSQINFNIGDGNDGRYYRLGRKVSGEFGIVQDPGNLHLFDISSSYAEFLPPTYFISGAFATGSLLVRSGSLSTISNNTTINIDNYLTSSLGGQSNIIKGWWDNPTPSGPQSNINNYTGSLRITGSNNIVSMPLIRATGLGGGADLQGYISGSDNTFASNASGIFLNTGSLLFPKTTNNYIGGNSNMFLNFTTSSLAGGHPIIQNNTLYAGAVTINSNSGSIQAFAGNIINGGSITSTQNFVTNTRPSISTNFVNQSTTLNHISSSINYQNNISNTNVTVNNHLSSSNITNNNLGITNNVFFGGSANTGVSIWVSGSQSSNATRNIIDNLIGGKNTTISSSFVSSSNSSLTATVVYGQSLSVNGNNGTGTAAGGAAFLGRFNDTGSLANSNDIVFAVGTGTAAANRRTGLYVTSGSLVGISGSMDIKGVTNALVVTGSQTIQHSVAGQPALTVIAQSIGQPALTMSGSLNVSGSGDHNIAGNTLNVVGRTIMSGNSDFPLYVSGTIQTQRLHFDGNPFNTNPSSNLGAIRYGSDNQTFQYTNYDKAEITSQSFIDQYVNTGSLTSQTRFGATYGGSTARIDVINNNGTKRVDILTDSMTVTGSMNISYVMNMRPLNPLPAGNIGDLAVSSSNQLYFYNGAWTLVV